jgi:hypothetical protein
MSPSSQSVRGRLLKLRFRKLGEIHDGEGRRHEIRLTTEGRRRVLYAFVDKGTALCLDVLAPNTEARHPAASGTPEAAILAEYECSVVEQAAEAEAEGTTALPSSRRFLCREVEAEDLEEEERNGRRGAVTARDRRVATAVG